MNKIISAVVILFVIIGGILFFRNRTVAPTQVDEVGSMSAGPTDTAASVKEFTVTGSNFKFVPSALAVNKGDKVRITFVNAGGIHDFKIDEFNVKTSMLSGGQSQTVEFVADKTGAFEYYCSMGTHRQMGMRGTLTVN